MINLVQFVLVSYFVIRVTIDFRIRTSFVCDFAISSLAINFGLCCDKLFDLVPLIQVHRRIVGKIGSLYLFSLSVRYRSFGCHYFGYL